MDNQENRSRTDGSHRDPTLFLVQDWTECWVGLRDGPRIVENEYGSFKTNIMLAKVLAIFALVPFESHGSSSFQVRITIEGLLVNIFVRTLTNASLRAESAHHNASFLVISYFGFSRVRVPAPQEDFWGD